MRVERYVFYNMQLKILTATLVVPAIGMISSPWASTQASAT